MRLNELLGFSFCTTENHGVFEDFKLDSERFKPILAVIRIDE